MKKQSINQAASLMGRVKSPAKAAAARENGKKGGRPRKQSENKPSGSVRENGQVPSSSERTHSRKEITYPALLPERVLRFV